MQEINQVIRVIMIGGLWTLMMMETGCRDSVPEEDCVQIKELNPFRFELRYRSPIKEAHKKVEDDTQDLDTQLEKEKKMRYFDLQIVANQENIWTDDQLYYFSYRFQNDIYLEENNEKLPCVLYHFEENAGDQQIRRFVLGFENPNETNDSGTFVINSELLNIGIIKLHPNCVDSN